MCDMRGIIYTKMKRWLADGFNKTIIDFINKVIFIIVELVKHWTLDDFVGLYRYNMVYSKRCERLYDYFEITS